jgi:hypothetical protein
MLNYRRSSANINRNDSAISDWQLSHVDGLPDEMYADWLEGINDIKTFEPKVFDVGAAKRRIRQIRKLISG